MMRSRVMKTVVMVLSALVGLVILGILIDQAHVFVGLQSQQWFFVAAALIIGLLSLVFRTRAWAQQINSVEHNSTISKYAILWSIGVSRLGRYTPGGVVGIGARAYFARSMGLSPKKSAGVSLLDTVLVTAAAIDTILIIGILYALVTKGYFILTVIALVVVLIVIVIYSVRALLVRLISAKYSEVVDTIDIRALAFAYLDLTIFYVLRGVAFVILATSFVDMLQHEILLMAGLFVVASVVTILAFITPAGLGITEVSLYAGLLLVVQPEIALLLVALSRVWDICVDLLFFGLAYAVQKIYGVKVGGNSA